MSQDRNQSARMLAELSQYVNAHPYPFVVDLMQSQGVWLATVDGERLMDMGGLYGSRLLGYNHPRLFDEDYVRRLVYAANTKMANPDFLTPECLEYYRLLHRLHPKCMESHKVEVFTVNSGAEAVEMVMKYLINLHNLKQAAKGNPDPAQRFIYFDQAYHERTVFALAPGNFQLPFPEYDARRSMHDNERICDLSLAQIESYIEAYPGQIAGIMLEPLQGAGGHRMALPRFYQGLSELCHRYDIGWALDESQTAGGQTGAIFSIDLFDIAHPPSAVIAAKKFANGVIYLLDPPEQAVVRDSTWGGSLADMVRFVQEWSVVEDEDLINAVEAKGNRLFSGLNALADTYDQVIGNVRGLGLYMGFSLHDKTNRARLIDRAYGEENLLLLTAGADSIRLRPPLDITEDEIDDMLKRLGRVLATF